MSGAADSANVNELPPGLTRKNTTPEREMAAFEQLPPLLQQVVQYVPIDISSEDVLRAWRRHPHRIAEIAIFVTELGRQAAGQKSPLLDAIHQPS